MATFTPKFDGAAAIKKAIGSTVSRTNGLKNHNQHVVLSCLYHITIHGDWTLLASLCGDNTLLATRMIGYAEKHMHATFDKKAGRFDYAEGKSADDIDVEAAAKEKWFEFKAPVVDRTKELREIRDAVEKTLKASVKADKVAEIEQTEILATIDALIEQREQVKEEAA